MYRLITVNGREIRRSTSREALESFLGFLDARVQRLTASGWETLS